MIRVDEYSPYINRFLQPDTIIPNPANPQAFNRFSYVGNNPIRFNDPSGHNEECGLGELGCNAGRYTPPPDQRGSLDRVLASYGITTTGLTRQERWATLRAARQVGDKFAEIRGKGESASEAFTAVYDPISFVKEDREGCFYDNSINQVRCGDITYDDFQSSINNVVHELGHVFNQLIGGAPNDLGLKYDPYRNYILRPDLGIDWQQHPPTKGPDPIGGDMFGDMFVAWVFSAWNTDPLNVDLVKVASSDMDNLMKDWLNR